MKRHSITLYRLLALAVSFSICISNVAYAWNIATPSNYTEETSKVIEDDLIKYTEIKPAKAPLMAPSAGNIVVDEGTCGTDLNWTLTGEEGDYTLTVSGTGAMTSYQDTRQYPWASYKDKITSLVMEGGTSIENYAFYNCQNLTDVLLNDGIEVIRDSAFEYCTSLQSIDISDSVIRIQDRAFQNCNSLSSIQLSDNLQYIGSYVFKGCTSLTELRIPASVTSIGSGIFENTTAGNVPITDIYYDGSASDWAAITIGTNGELDAVEIHYATANQEGWVWEEDAQNWRYYENGEYVCWMWREKDGFLRFLGTDGYIITNDFIDDGTDLYYVDNEGVRVLGWFELNDHRYYATSEGKLARARIMEIEGVEYVFDQEGICTGENLPDGVIASAKCGENAIWTLTGESDNLTLTIKGSGMVNREYYNPDTGELVPNWNDYGESIKHLLIEESITGFEGFTEEFFSSCALEDINITAPIEYIPYMLFAGLPNLQAITITDSLSRMGDNVFGGSSTLTDIYFAGSEEEWNNIVFEGDSDYYNNLTIHFGRDGYDVVESGTCGEDLTWKVVRTAAGLTLRISGTGEMDESIPWSGYRSDVRYITVENGVTSISAGAFTGFSAAERIDLPETVISVGTGAFSECTSINTIGLPSGITAIPERLFENCTALGYIYLPDQCRSIGVEAFSGCTGLSSIYSFPNQLEIIGDRAFAGCLALNDVNLPDSVIEIGESAFNGCASLIRVFLPEGMSSISTGLFEDCTGLVSIGMPSAINVIEANAFSGCSYLTDITIGDELQTIQAGAFHGCESLTDIYYSGTEEQWGTIAIGSDNDPLTRAAIHYNADESDTYVDSGKCGENAVWTLTGEGNNLTLTISGSGTCYVDYSYYNEEWENIRHLWDSYNDRIKSVIVEGEIESIACMDNGYTFNDSQVRSIEITAPVTSLQSFCFFGTSKLSVLKLPETITVIQDSAFEHANNLSQVYYAGSGEEWENIQIEWGNDSLHRANVQCAAGDNRISVTYVSPDGSLLRKPYSDETGTSIEIRYAPGSELGSKEKPSAEHANVEFYLDEEFTESAYDSLNIIDDLIIYVKVQPFFNITWDANGGRFEDGNTQQIQTDIWGSLGAWGVSTPFSEEAIFDGWYYDEGCTEPVNFETAQAGSLTVYAKWSTDFVKVTFISPNGEMMHNPETGEESSVVTIKAMPGAGFYDFSHPSVDNAELEWYADEGLTERYDEGNPINENCYIYCKVLHQYEITWNANGGQFSDGSDIKQELRCGTFNRNYNEEPYRDDAIFDGWYYDAECTEPVDGDAELNGALTVYAKWSTDFAVVTFVSPDGYLLRDTYTGEYFDTIQYKYAPGSEFQSKIAPEVDGAVTWWYKDETLTEEINGDEIVSDGLTVYARVMPWYELTWDANGGHFADGESIKTESNSGSVPQSYETPIHDNAIFAGWYYDAECTEPVNFEVDQKESLTVFAKWSTEFVTITFVSPNGQLMRDTQTGNYAASITVKYLPGEALEAHPNPEADNAVIWWYVDEALTEHFGDFSTTINEDITLYAKIMPWFRVTRNANGGHFSDGEEIHVADSYHTIGWDEEPVKENTVFTGWYYDAECTEAVDLDEERDSDVTIYAGWASEGMVTVTVHYSNPYYTGDPVEEIKTQKYLRGENLDSREIERPDYGVSYYGAAYYLDEEHTQVYYTYDPIYEDLTIYCVIVPGYDLTYDANGGQFTDENGRIDCIYTQGYSDEPIKNSNVPYRDGFAFTGWYYDPECRNPVGEDCTTGELTVYAGWTTDYVTVTYVSADTELKDSYSGNTGYQIVKNYTVGQSLNDMSSPGANGDRYYELYWYYDADFTQPVEDWSLPVTESITLYAKNNGPFIVTLDANGGAFDSGLSELASEGWYSYSNYYEPINNNTKPHWSNSDYTFDGWYYDAEGTRPVDEYDNITRDVRIYAKWTNDIVRMIFTTSDGTPLLDPYTGEYKDAVVMSYKKGSTLSSQTPPAPERGYVLDWYTDYSLKNIYAAGAITEPVTLYARIRHQFDLTLDAGEGHFVLPNGTEPSEYVTGIYEDNIYRNADLKLPVKDGAAFDGWYLEESCETPLDLDAQPTGDLRVYAKWTEDIVTVTFNTCFGDFDFRDPVNDTVGASVTRNYKTGSKLNEIALPYISNVSYSNIVTWYSDRDLTNAFDEDTVLEEDIALYAKPTFTFDDGGIYLNCDNSILDKGESTQISIHMEVLPNGYSLDHVEWIYDTGLATVTDAGNLTYNLTANEYGTFALQAVVYIDSPYDSELILVNEKYWSEIKITSPEGTPYKLVYKANYDGASVKEYVQEMTTGYVELPDAESIGISREGYGFVGWAESPDVSYHDIDNIHFVFSEDSFYDYGVDDTYVPVIPGENAVITLYAVWGPENYIRLMYWYIDRSEMPFETLELEVGEEYSLTIGTEPINAYIDTEVPTQYISKDPSIALVDQTGKITAVAEGETQIYALYNQELAEGQDPEGLASRNGHFWSRLDVRVLDSGSDEDHWELVGDKWKYKDKNGEYITNAWKKKDGTYRYLGDEGYMLTEELIVEDE